MKHTFRCFALGAAFSVGWGITNQLVEANRLERNRLRAASVECQRDDYLRAAEVANEAGDHLTAEKDAEMGLHYKEEAILLLTGSDGK